MRKYNFNGKIETLKTSPKEVTVGEFQSITKDQEHYGDFMYYLTTFERLGLSKQFIDSIDAETLFTIIKDFQDDFVVNNNDFTKTIEIDGHTYSAFEDKFRISARDFARIENAMQKDPYGWITYALAVIFKRDDLSDKEHYASGHIKHKEKLFKDVTMDVALPYIIYCSETYINNIKLIANI